MEYIEKDCKRFITKLTKLINSISKYNVETIWLLQVSIDTLQNIFEPVIICKKYNLDIFKYMKLIYEGTSYENHIETLELAKNKITLEESIFSPIIFGAFRPQAFFNNKFSSTYFIVGETFKQFIKDFDITKVTSELEFFGSDPNIPLNTDTFLYKNTSPEKLINKTVMDQISPKYVLSSDETLQEYLPNNLVTILKSSFEDGFKQSKADHTYDKEEIKIITDMTKEFSYYNLDAKVCDCDVPITKSVKTFPDFLKINPTFMAASTGDEICEIGIFQNVSLNLTNKDVSLNILYRYLEDGNG
jgi:hypothetical protein